MKYNPSKIDDLSKSKMIQRAGYHKGTFITDTGKLAEIITNGGQVEMKAQEVRMLGTEQVQVIECRIFFVNP